MRLEFSVKGNQAQRRVVFLQGPVGPFFARLQDSMDGAGWETIRILFNRGDGAFRGKGRTISFSDPMPTWAAWFEEFVGNFRPDVILLFGDQRRPHREARELADRLGVAVICFEEGYLRPEYITMELGGNNANSPLRYGDLSCPDVKTYDLKMPSNGFPQTVRHAIRYFVAMRIGMLSYPYYKHHRHRPLIRESLFWARNALRKRRYRIVNYQKNETIIDHYDKRYFVVALQVHDDLQLRHHGDGWTLQRMIETSVATFARSANPQHHLVFKGHPLDRGHASTREYVEKVADIYGISDRVHYVDDGSLGLLARHSRGMVTINSTSAMVAFNHGKPVFAFGASFYEALTANGTHRSAAALERFWRLSVVFDHEKWLKFRAAMVANSLVSGSYYILEELDGTCTRVIERLEHLLAQHRAQNGSRRPAPAVDVDGASRPALQDNIRRLNPV